MNRRDFLVHGAVTTAALGCGSRPVEPPAPVSTASDWTAARAQLLIPRDVAYGNTATLGASPRSVVDATIAQLRSVEHDLAEYRYHKDPEPPHSGYAKFSALRTKLAGMFGAHADELALTQNTTIGMAIVAHAIRLQPGDEIVLSDQEHSGGSCSWRAVASRSGATIRTVAITATMSAAEVIDVFANAMTERTRVLSVSHVTSERGLVLPVKALAVLARDRDVVSVVDGAQALGHVPLDLHDLGCDYYAASGHKWLCAPKGCGLLYVRRDRLAETPALVAGQHWEDPEWAAARLQPSGTGNIALLKGLDVALDHYRDLGPTRIATRVQDLRRQLIAGLATISRVVVTSSLRDDTSAGMATFRVDGMTALALQDALYAAKIRVRSQSEETGVRMCTHYYVLEDDIERILATVRSVAG